jgi:hypothetical protein
MLGCDSRPTHPAIKKAPPGNACLDEIQIWPTGGARSRNHKKMSRPALLMKSEIIAL